MLHGIRMLVIIDGELDSDLCNWFKTSFGDNNSTGVSIKSSALIGLWKEDQAPLKHITVESIRGEGNCTLDHSHCCTDGPIAPVEDMTIGVNDLCSTSRTLFLYALLFSFSWHL